MTAIARLQALASNLAFTHTPIPPYEAVADLLMRPGVWLGCEAHRAWWA